MHLAVLHPRLLSVYSLVFKAGKTDYGNQSYLQQLYEHKLRRSAANFVIGPFGGSQNRDFICVQSLDGILSFFEQESQVSYVALPDFLLHGPLCYVVKTDSFLTVSSEWGIVTYKYKILSEAADESADPIYAKPKIFSEWLYNLGESVIDIQVINDIVNRETWIMVLGEKNLFCLTENGGLKFMKKLDFCPICIHSYVIDTYVFSLIVAETNMLLVYEKTTLKWSAHLDYLPIALHRIFLKRIKGALVLLTDEGRLECCYLGTEPSFFVAPPLNVQDIDFLKAEQELLALEKVITSSNNSDVTIQNNVEKELQVNISINAQIEVCIYEHNIRNAASNYMCGIKIDIQPHVTFQEVQVSISVQRPLKVVPSIQFFSNLSETTSFFCYVFLDEAQDVPSLEVEVKASVITNLGVPRTISRTAMLPITLILETCSPEKENKNKVTLSTNQAPLGLLNLFPEYNDSQSSPNAVGFKSASGNTGTILLAKSSERYRLQSDTFTMLSILVEQLILRLKKHFNNVADYRISFNSPLPASEIFNYANEHFVVKKKVNELQANLSQLSAQFRLIQKRLITKYRAKNPTSLKSLEILLNDSYTDIYETTEKLENEMENLSKSQTDLSCSLHLVKQLTGLLKIDSELMNSISSVFCLRVYDLDAQAWEDVMDASLCYLLRTVMAKTEKDRLRAPHTRFDEVKDLSKFEKHLNQVLERLPKQNILKESDGIFGEEESVKECIVETEDNKKLEKPVGSQYGEFSSRLLSARKSLLTKRHKINESQKDDARSEDQN